MWIEKWVIWETLRLFYLVNVLKQLLVFRLESNQSKTCCFVIRTGIVSLCVCHDFDSKSKCTSVWIIRSRISDSSSIFLSPPFRQEFEDLKKGCESLIIIIIT